MCSPTEGDVIIGLGAGGESGGFIGTKAMLDRGLRADVAVVGEPSELEITYCQRGAVWHEWSIAGKTGLTGRPGSVNAVHKAVKLASALVELNDQMDAQPHPLVGRPQLSVNFIQGGTQFYNVPDRCVLKTDRRLVPGETTSAIIAQLESLAGRMRASDPDLDFSMELKLEIPQWRRRSIHLSSKRRSRRSTK